MAAASRHYSMQTLLAAKDTAADLSSGCAGMQQAIHPGQSPMYLIIELFSNQHQET